jgi:hypothetical protein
MGERNRTSREMCHARPRHERRATRGTPQSPPRGARGDHQLHYHEGHEDREGKSGNSRSDAKTQGKKGSEGIGDSGRVGYAHRLWFTPETPSPAKEPGTCSIVGDPPAGMPKGDGRKKRKGPKGEIRRVTLNHGTLFAFSFVLFGCPPENMPDLVRSRLRSQPLAGRSVSQRPMDGRDRCASGASIHA